MEWGSNYVREVEKRPNYPSCQVSLRNLDTTRGHCEGGYAPFLIIEMWRVCVSAL